MAKRRQCARCGTYNAFNARECKDCSAVFNTSAEAPKASPRGTRMCEWRDAGITCTHVGIISFGTNGSGPMYCREHADRKLGIEPDAEGNTVRRPAQSPSVAQRLKGWIYDSKTRRYVAQSTEAACSQVNARA